MGVGVQAKRDWPIQRAPRPGRWCAHRDLPSSFLGAPFPRSPISRSPSSKENRPPKREGEGEHVTTVFNLSWAARSIHPGERRGQERRKSALQRNRLVTSPVVKLVDSVVVGRRVTGLLRLYLLRRALVLTRRFRSPLSLSSNSSSFILAIAYNQYTKSYGSKTQGATTSAETHTVRCPPLTSHLCAFGHALAWVTTCRAPASRESALARRQGCPRFAL